MKRTTADIKGFHAHVYYEPATREMAARVREGLSHFNVELGRWHDEPVGPHLKSMYQVAFAPEEFGKVVPWLMLNREGLDVLVHARTGGDAKGDHLDRALWLGTKLPLNVEVLERAGE
ncbi:MAG TPA: DOPA 4,5-dioxygenase family protein [Candidatus Acidoferrales bacterium]|nr:DOPA 4,5-dioxygenase family protein [Candidatus Acidoferrales bacterium]